MVDNLDQHLELRTQEALNDPRSTHELISQALMEPDEEGAWDAVVLLHFRGTREVFDAACQLCVSYCSLERAVGANILGQLGVPVRAFPAESAKLLAALLALEDDERALGAMCTALGHLRINDAIPALCRLKSHPSADIRFDVAFALSTYEDALVIETLIELSKDREVMVRDWATFGLGTQIEADTAEIRTALFERVFDEDEVTRGEALVGLARRKDQRIIEPLIKELERFPIAERTFSVEAAEELGDSRLLPVLIKLKHSSEIEDTTFDAAIRRCSTNG
jgi:HEAT repeat protein